MFKKKLTGILSGFTKAQKELETFLKSNQKKIEKDRLELEVKEREQEKAQAVLKNIEEFLNESTDSKRVPEASE